MAKDKQNFFQAISKFLKEVTAELKKVSWTTRQELVNSAWVVIVSAFFLGFFIAITDLILSGAISKLIN